MIGRRQTFASIILLVSCGYYRADATKEVEDSGGVAPIYCTAQTMDTQWSQNTYICKDSTERIWHCSSDGGCIEIKETK